MGNCFRSPRSSIFFPLTLLLIAFLLAACATPGQDSQLGTIQAHQATQIGRQGEIISYLATRSPDRALLESQATQIAAQATELANLSTQVAGQDDLVKYLLTRQPTSVSVQRTPPSPTPYRPVLGTVIIEDGRCCVGGTAGETIQVEVVFVASSPLGEVTEMRVVPGNIQASEEEMAQAEWVPFVTSTTLSTQAALNWTSFSVSVQFRDSEDNLSKVFMDDISVEGHPPTPAP